MAAIPIEEYQEAMRENICRVCVSFAPDRANPTRCVLETSGQCTLFSHLDDVVEVVATVDSGSIEPYMTALRHQVCANCEHQNKRGVCELRDSRSPSPTWCVLDTYFNLIVGTIEEVAQSQKTLG